MSSTTRFTTPGRSLRFAAVGFAAAALFGAGCSSSDPVATISTIADGSTTTAAVPTSATSTSETATTETVPATTSPATTIPASTTPATSAPATTISGGLGDEEINVFLLPIGTCFVSGAEGDEGVQPVDCDVPHEGQKFADVPLDIDDYSDAAAKEVVDPVCRTEFEAFVGTDYDISDLFYIGLTPIERDWAEQDLGGVCIVVAQDGLLDFDAEDSNL